MRHHQHPRRIEAPDQRQQDQRKVDAAGGQQVGAMMNHSHGNQNGADGSGRPAANRRRVDESTRQTVANGMPLRASSPAAALRSTMWRRNRARANKAAVWWSVRGVMRRA